MKLSRTVHAILSSDPADMENDLFYALRVALLNGAVLPDESIFANVVKVVDNEPFSIGDGDTFIEWNEKTECFEVIIYHYNDYELARFTFPKKEK